MSDASLFVGAALPWLVNATEDVAQVVFDRLNHLLASPDGPRELIMRSLTVNDANGHQISVAAEPLSRWDHRSPEVIFREGFLPRIAPVDINDFHDTDDTNLNLRVFIDNHVRSIFVSTTRPVLPDNGSEVAEIWRPPVISGRYRYEIFAYGGVDILATFNGQREILSAEQQEIIFIGGIRPQLIRSATEYDDNGKLKYIWYNVQFNPLLNGDHAPRAYELPELPENINNIRFFDPDADNKQVPGPIRDQLRRRREAEQESNADNNRDDVDENNGNLSRYTLVKDRDASLILPSSHIRRACMFIPSKNEAIFFADTRFVTLRLDDAHNPKDTIAPEGVRSIIDAWPALYEANFPAIDAILPHPKNSDQAYFFFRDRYTLVNITTRQKVFDAKKIIDFWPSLKQVGFNTVDTAVLLSDETAYFFRGSQYVHVTVKPGTNDDKVIGNGPKSIKSNWPVLDKASFETVDAILPSPHGRDTNFFSGSNYVKMIIHEGSANDELTGPVKPVKEGWSSLVNANFY